MKVSLINGYLLFKEVEIPATKSILYTANIKSNDENLKTVVIVKDDENITIVRDLTPNLQNGNDPFNTLPQLIEKHTKNIDTSVLLLDTSKYCYNLKLDLTNNYYLANIDNILGVIEQ